MENLNHTQFLDRMGSALKKLEPAIDQKIYKVLSEAQRRLTLGTNDLKQRGKPGPKGGSPTKKEILNKYRNKT